MWVWFCTNVYPWNLRIWQGEAQPKGPLTNGLPWPKEVSNLNCLYLHNIMFLYSHEKELSVGNIKQQPRAWRGKLYRAIICIFLHLLTSLQAKDTRHCLPKLVWNFPHDIFLFTMMNIIKQINVSNLSPAVKEGWFVSACKSSLFNRRQKELRQFWIHTMTCKSTFIFSVSLQTVLSL